MNNREAMQEEFEAWWNGRQLPENMKAVFFMVWQAALVQANVNEQSQAQRDTVTVQQAWEWAGGNPEIKATQQDLEEALKMLDEVCDEADKPSQAQQESNSASNAAMEYALKNHDLEFLHAWFHGDFDAIRKEWSDAPEAVFIGADPLYKPAPEGDKS